MLYIDKTYKRFNKVITKKIPIYNNLYNKLKKVPYFVINLIILINI